MMNIILKDAKAKVFQVMRDLREETEMLVYDNMEKLNGTGMFLLAQDFSKAAADDLVNSGYTEDAALYDRLIIEYNQTNEPLLKRWI